jgi:hypothetical protein
MRWHKLSEVKPTEDQLIGGRAPAIDEDGYLVTELFIDGEPLSGEIKIIYWAEIDKPPSVKN